MQTVSSGYGYTLPGYCMTVAEQALRRGNNDHYAISIRQEAIRLVKSGLSQQAVRQQLGVGHITLLAWPSRGLNSSASPWPMPATTASPWPSGPVRTVAGGWETASGLTSCSVFTPLPTRWVVERSISCLQWDRRLSRDYECETSSAEATVYLSSIRHLIRKF